MAYPEGNPGALTAAAGRMSDLASRIERASASIAEGTRVPGWEGHRYGVFTTAGRALANVLEPGGAALRRASSDLTQLATQLKDAQRRIEAWADEIEAAEKRFRAAGTALNAAMFSVPFGAGSTSAPGPGKLGRAQTAFQRAGSDLEELRAQYVPKARQLCERVRQEDERTASALRGAAAAAPQGASAPVAASAAGGGGGGGGGGSGPLSFFDFKPNAEAGPANQDGTFGGHATVSIEAILANLHKEFNDGAGTTEIDGTVGVNAEASAKAEVGPHGVHVGLGGEAQAGAKGSFGGTLGDENSFALKPSIDGRIGPGAEAGAHIDVDSDGLHADAHLGVSPIIGGGVHVEVDVDPAGMMEDIINAPKNIDRIKHILGG